MLTKEERILIGKRIVAGEITVHDAEKEYHISRSSAQQYATNYRKSNGLPLRKTSPGMARKSEALDLDLESLQAMSKEELIDQLILSKVNELRLKKGYEVKGAGAKKEFVFLNSRNSKS